MSLPSLEWMLSRCRAAQRRVIFLYAVDGHDVAVSTQRLGSVNSVPVPAQPFKFLLLYQSTAYYSTITYVEMPYLDDQTFIMYTRDVGSQLTPNATQRTTLIVAGCYVIAIAILW